jgi:hypothetical protein
MHSPVHDYLMFQLKDQEAAMDWSWNHEMHRTTTITRKVESTDAHREYANSNKKGDGGGGDQDSDEDEQEAMTSSTATPFNGGGRSNEKLLRTVLEHLFAPIDKQGHIGDWRVYLATHTE